MVWIQCTMVYHNVPRHKFFVPWLHKDVPWYSQNVPWYTTVYHGTSYLYHGTVTPYHGIPLFSVVYHVCTMVVPWYFLRRTL